MSSFFFHYSCANHVIRYVARVRKPVFPAVPRVDSSAGMANVSESVRLVHSSDPEVEGAV